MTVIHARSEWADIRPRFSPSRKNVPDVFIHHEGGARRGNPADKGRVLREIEHGVLGKGYIAIDYDIMVFQDGSIWEGRGFANEDAATIHNNPTSQSICAVGNFQLEVPTPALIDGIAQAVVAASRGQWVVDRPNIRPHRAVFATACPGSNLLNYMGELSARVNALRNTGGLTPVPPKTQQRRMNKMIGFFWRDDDGAVYYCDGTSNTHLSPDQLAAYTWIAAVGGATPAQLAVGDLSKNGDTEKRLRGLPKVGLP